MALVSHVIRIDSGEPVNMEIKMTLWRILSLIP